MVIVAAELLSGCKQEFEGVQVKQYTINIRLLLADEKQVTMKVWRWVLNACMTFLGACTALVLQHGSRVLGLPGSDMSSS